MGGACLKAPIAGLLILTWAPAALAAPPAVIRTGGPSAPGDAKRAMVLADKALAGKAFTVKDATGRVALRGRLAKAPGSTRPWRRAAVADLSALAVPGSYRVEAAGIRASRPWVVVDGAASTSQAVRTVLRFFAVNADGTEPSPAHGPSHLNDATVRGGPLDGQRIDLTGGWMDAGDTLKFTHTTAYSVIAMLLAARLDPADAEQLRGAAGVGVRWLLKAHPTPDVFVSQVGEIHSDHDRDPATGFDPAADDRSPVAAVAQRQALTGIGLDSGGIAAAALALAGQAEPDPAARERLLVAAREWYEAGERANKLAPPLPENPYPSSAGDDDMALAAIELHRATGSAQYLADALDWAVGLEAGESINWDNLTGLVGAELCGAAGAPAPSSEAATRGCALLASTAQAAAGRAARHAVGTAGELAFGTTATHGGAGAALALAPAAGFVSGRVLAADARDWVLGRNAWGRSFVAGLGPLAPRRPHHWAVRRGPAIFAGAVVGGPTTSQILEQQKLKVPRGPFDGPAGVYEDRVANYVTSEVAIDYAASTLLLFAALAPR